MTHEPLAEGPSRAPYTAEDVDRYVDNLPTIAAQELRIIGRSVSFHGHTVVAGETKSFVYKGMVAHISKETVTLLDCIRYEEAVFAEAGTAEVELSKFPLVLPSAIRVEPIPVEGCFGRIPYMTFLRRKITRVKFETDTPLVSTDRQRFMGMAAPASEEGGDSAAVQPPPSSTLEAFRDTQWHLHDEQKLRMLIRRYIVHTSQNNNSQKLSLRQFLDARLEKRTPPSEVLAPIVNDEVAHMEQVAKTIAGGQPPPPQRIGQQNGGLRGNAPIAQRAFLAAGTLSARTSYVAILHIALAIGILLYSASVITMADGLLVADFVRPFITYVAIAAALLLFAGCVSGLHGLRLQQPSCRVLTGRIVFIAAAGSLLGYALYVVAGGMYSDRQPDSTSMKQYYVQKVQTSPNDVCSYFIRKACSGFDRNCAVPASNAAQCPSCTSNGSQTCARSVQEAVNDGLLPLLALLIAGEASILLDIIMFVTYVVT